LYFSDETQKKSRELTEKWQHDVQETLKSNPDQKERFTTVSDLDIKRLYTPEDLTDMDFARDISVPGEFPYLRGNQVTGYRGRHWTFRMFAGMGSAQDTNARWHMLLREGQTGLSTAFDFPTLMGYDSDSSRCLGEVGKCGVAIDTLEDFLALIDHIPLDQVTTSMTINPPATVL
jgi:methylmalonyl-CoA mutase N-terminal domain/subunit